MTVRAMHLRTDVSKAARAEADPPIDPRSIRTVRETHDLAPPDSRSSPPRLDPIEGPEPGGACADPARLHALLRRDPRSRPDRRCPGRGRQCSPRGRVPGGP